jgi:acetyl-CoA C-acetyltransferase
MQRGAPVESDEIRVCPNDTSTLPPSFDEDGTVTGFTFAPPADGVTVIVLTREPMGAEVLGVGRSAGDPLDPLGAIEAAVETAAGAVARSEVARWELTEPTAAATLLAIERLGLDPTRVNRAGGTLGVGDAGAAEELRLLADGLDHGRTGELLVAGTFGPSGAAATLVRCP